VDAKFLIRVEDTDLDRNQPEHVAVIFEVLNWLGIGADAEPVYQSSLASQHSEAVDQLLAAGHAYRCDCTQEESKARAEARGRPGYDGYCRDRGVTADTTSVVRFRTPDEGTTSWDDLIRGNVSFENSNLEDFVLLRADGTPMFIVANTTAGLSGSARCACT